MQNFETQIGCGSGSHGKQQGMQASGRPSKQLNDPHQDVGYPSDDKSNQYPGATATKWAPQLPQCNVLWTKN